MPRKAKVYWIGKPLDLNKCHSRRCDSPAMRDRLCAKHYAAWQMAGFLPKMPEQYSSGRNTEPTVAPLKAELGAEAAVMDEAMDAVARMAVDDAATPETLETLLGELHDAKRKLDAKKKESIAPLLAAAKRTTGWFEPVEKKVDAVIELAEKRLETSRSTIQNLRPQPPKKRKAGK